MKETTCTLTLGKDGRRIPVDVGAPLATALQRAGVALAMPCGGRKTCGKCLVWVAGPVSAAGATEREMLARYASLVPPVAGSTPRLACFCAPLGDCTVWIPEAEAAVLVEGAGSLPAYDGSTPDALGIAIDVGTTTIAMALYDLPGGILLATQSALNCQGAYGADVLSRIAYADQHGHAIPASALQGQLRDMAQALLRDASRDADGIARVVVTGNTTMLHFVHGLDPHGIGQSPFIPESLFGCEESAGALFPFAPERATLYTPRCVSAYVGADITCGMVAGSLVQDGARRLLVDVGTNGEMALWASDTLYCCATAAGPAFEGAQIAMGMAAAPGAICGVRMGADGAVVADTIGGMPALGICGTGLISAVRMLLETGYLDPGGTLEAPSAQDTRMTEYEGAPAFALGNGVVLTAQDIREVQLAKAAIAAGIDTLLHTAGIAPGALNALLLAGGFGSVLNPADAAAIGLIPQGVAGRAQAMGNLALSGAAMMLFSRATRDTGEACARAAQEVPLATNPYFMDKYVEHMMFPEE